jgi:ABC-type nitrate/sulfonate/bicarbonate transport system permease component
VLGVPIGHLARGRHAASLDLRPAFVFLRNLPPLAYFSLS